MKNAIKISAVIIVSVGLFSSCSDISKKVEDKINELNNKTEKLDSLVNSEFDKVISLDSLINKESDKVKKLDSLINKSSSKIDSIANDKVNSLKKFKN